MTGIGGRVNWERVEVTAGTRVIRQGDPGDRFYIVTRGRLAVEVDGRVMATLSDGDQFGEIALLRNVPRTATATAIEPTELLALGRDAFLAALTGSRPSSIRANELVDRRLDELGRDE